VSYIKFNYLVFNDKLKKNFDDKVKNFVFEMARKPQFINDYHEKGYITKDNEEPMKVLKEHITDRMRIVYI